jgi:hypothetical protein
MTGEENGPDRKDLPPLLGRAKAEQRLAEAGRGGSEAAASK